MSVQLLVIQGKERGKCLTFPVGEFVFGRGPECHVRPNSELVSRQHCLLAVGHEVTHIRDLGSTNGTLVNGKLVLGEQILSDGDRLQLGPVVLLFKISGSDTDTLPDAQIVQKGDTIKSDSEEPKQTPTIEGDLSAAFRNASNIGHP